jgi:hypothetical protein
VGALASNLTTRERAPARRGLAAERKGKRPPAMSPVAWMPQQDLEFIDWVESGRRLGLLGRSAAWWLGDWLRFGNARYGERYARAARITGYDPQTLMNMAYVASHFDASRRRENLSWSHHAELAAMDASDQEGWLSRAERDHLSVRCLREEMRRERLVLKREQDRLESGDVSVLPSCADEADPVVCPECGCSFGAPAPDDTDH